MNLNELSIDTCRVVNSRGVLANTFPTHERPPLRIAFVSDAPTDEDAKLGKWLAGSGGYLFDQVLGSAQIPRHCAYLGHICKEVPPLNDVENFMFDGPEIQEGLAQLRIDFATWRPNIVVLIGDFALKVAMGVQHSKGVFVNDYRGSLFTCDNPNLPFFGMKCMGILHPKVILQQYELKQFLRLDIERAKVEGGKPEFIPTGRRLDVHVNAHECVQRLMSIPDDSTIAIDIEGGVYGMTCISVALSPYEVFICHFANYSEEGEALVMRALGQVLANPYIGKILQNALYDQFVLAYRYNILVRNVCHDTMLSGWEIYPELPKALGVQTSIWTREPYYKSDRKSTNIQTHLEYCCKDSAVTFEIADRHLAVFDKKPKAHEHFTFNMSMLAPLLYMELRGLRYDSAEAKNLHAIEHIKLTEIEQQMAIRCGEPLNPNSPKQCCRILYDVLNFPVQHPKKKSGFGFDKTKRTADVSAILKLAKTYKDPLLFQILSWRHHDGRRSDLEITSDPDGRVRCSYNVVGTDTGRLSCQKSPTDSGMNLQTVTSSLRKLFLADDGYHFFQCDLAGADGWTVAAHTKQLGDHAMYLDYMHGLKPAKILALLYKYGPQINKASRDHLLELSKEITEKGEEGWLYFACKRVQHGTNYLLGKDTMSKQILHDSFKKLGRAIDVDPKECAKLQGLYLSRYFGVPYWQNKIKQLIATTGELPCASGHVRRFFGRPSDNTTYQAAVAHEPQANTTYATNRAILALWADPDNRRPDGSLIIEPLHQVHDAVLGQFPIELTDWATMKIRSYFNNPLTIANMSITIPFDGGYGRSWGELYNPL